jgi:hypothetical protein
MEKRDLEFERAVMAIAFSDMLLHLEDMRAVGESRLPDATLRTYGCSTMRDYVMKVKALAAGADAPLPTFVDDYLTHGPA